MHRRVIDDMFIEAAHAAADQVSAEQLKLSVRLTMSHTTYERSHD